MNIFSFNFVFHHTRFDKDATLTGAKLFYQQFDTYDKANNKDAITFLKNSVNDEIKMEMDLANEGKPILYFPHQWKLLIGCICIPSASRYETIKDTMRARKIDS